MTNLDPADIFFTKFIVNNQAEIRSWQMIEDYSDYHCWRCNDFKQFVENYNQQARLGKKRCMGYRSMWTVSTVISEIRIYCLFLPKCITSPCPEK